MPALWTPPRRSVQPYFAAPNVHIHTRVPVQGVPRTYHRPSADSGAMTLTQFAAYWGLDEASGTRVDLGPNGQDLTDNNTVTQAGGKINNAAQFTFGNTEYLSRADSTVVSIGAGVSFEWTGFLYLDSKAANYGVFGKDDGAGQREYLMRYESAADRFVFYVRNIGNTAFTSVTASTFGSPSTATWYWFDCYYDQPNGNIGISINRGAFNTASHGTGGVYDGTATFALGAQGVGLGIEWNGRLDEVGFIKSLLTTAQQDWLYNSGNGNRPT